MDRAMTAAESRRFQESIKEQEMAAANTPNIDQLAIHGDTSTRRGIANSRFVSPSILESMVNDVDEVVLWRLGSNPSTPIHVIERLATHPSDQVRRFVASNENISTKLAMMLSRDSSEIVRGGVAGNHDVNDPDITNRLSMDGSPNVRAQVSWYTSDIRALELLSGDGDNHVRLGVANNEHTSISLLDKLSNDPIGSVRRDAKIKLRSRLYKEHCST